MVPASRKDCVVNWITASLLYFADDTFSVSRIAIGTRKECERAAELIPAVIYNGGKQVKESRLYCGPACVSCNGSGIGLEYVDAMPVCESECVPCMGTGLGGANRQ